MLKTKVNGLHINIEDLKKSVSNVMIDRERITIENISLKKERNL